MAVWILRIISIIWYALFFGIVLPVTLVLISLSLDVQLEERFSIGLDWSVPLVVTGVIFLVAAIALVIISSLTLHRNGKGFPWSFGSHVAYNPQKLVTSGPYAVVRNPMATSYLLFLLSIGCILPSLVMIVWIVPLTGGLLYEYFEFTEEKRLAAWFGKEYTEYAKRTPSLLPRFSSLWQNFGKQA